VYGTLSAGEQKLNLKNAFLVLNLPNVLRRVVMDFLGGALPNVMFIVGIVAIGLGLGIELKLVPLNKEIDKTGRVGAIIVGAILVAASLVIYLNPSLANRGQAAGTATSAANVQAIVPVVPSPSTLAEAPTLAVMVEPAATAVSIAATAPAAATAAPAATVALPDATAVPTVSVPPLRGLDEKAARRAIEMAGLKPVKADRCTGSDQGDPKAKKGHVQCQNPAAGVAVELGTTIAYVLAGK
jgi:hypothetical protein